MIDSAEIERWRRKWLFMAVAFPAFWLIYPLVLASALAVWLLGLMLAYLFDWFPRSGTLDCVFQAELSDCVCRLFRSLWEWFYGLFGS